MSSAADRLLAVVDQEIQKKPFLFLGMTWCRLSTAQLAARLEVAEITVRRAVRAEEVQRHVCIVNKIKVTLTRRNNGNTTPEFRATVAARAMSKMFTKCTGKRVDSQAFGCLVGLAKAWPEKTRLKIFDYNLRNWSEFMVGHKFTESLKINPHPNHDRYLEFPNILVLRYGAEVALEVYAMHLQDKWTEPK